MIRSVLSVVAVLALPAASVRADVADIAELFPAETLAYAELRNPEAVAKVMAGWTKETPLENGMKLVQDRKDEISDATGPVGQIPVGMATLLTSPEFLREVGRFGGAAVGLTGFSEKSEPQVVAVVLFGESTAGGLLARGILTTSRDLRRIDTVDGVPILQHRAFPPPAVGNDGKPIPFENPKPTEGAYEATYAYRPGLLVVGTDKALVADVIRRFAGKRSGVPLAERPSFNRFAEERKRAGLFFYAVPPALTKSLNAARKANRDAIDSDALALLNFAANPAAFPVIGGNVTLGPDDVALQVRADIAPGQSSPVLNLLAGTGSSHFLALAPEGVAAAFAFALPPPGQRARAVLSFWDACEKARGELGPLPSDRLAEAEKRVALNVRDGVLHRLTAVTAVFPERQELPKATPQLPLFACHSESDVDADAILAAVPKLVQLATGSSMLPQASTETIQGQLIWSLSLGDSVGSPVIHYAKSGRLLIIGLDRKWVARLAVGGGGQRPGDRPREVESPSALSGRLRLGPLVRLAGVAQASKRTSPVTAGGNTSLSSGTLAELLDTLPPGTFHVTFETNQLSATLSLHGLRAHLPAFVKKLIPWLERIGAEAVSADGDSIPRLQLDR